MDSGFPDPTKGQAVWSAWTSCGQSSYEFSWHGFPKTDRITRVFSIPRFLILFEEKRSTWEMFFHLCKKTYPPKKLTVCHRAIILLFPGKYQQNGWCSSQLCFFHTGVYHQTGKKNLSKGKSSCPRNPPISPCPWPPQRWQQSCRSEKIWPWQPMLQWKIGGPSNMNRLSPSSHVST